MATLETLSDEALVARIRGGDEVALRVLADRCSLTLRRQIERGLSRRIRRRIDPSDILQEAQLVALEHLADFEDRGAGSFGAWFRELVARRIDEAVRRHVGARKRTVMLETTRAARCPTGELRGREGSPSQVLMGAELETSVHAAIAELPAHYREVLLLLQGEGLTTDEVAERTGRTAQSVRQLYARALARLEKALGVGKGRQGGRRRPTR